MKSYLWLNLQCLNLVAYTGQVRVPRAAWITVLVILFLLTRMSFHPTESACFNRLQVLFRSFGLPFFARRIALFFIFVHAFVYLWFTKCTKFVSLIGYIKIYLLSNGIYLASKSKKFNRFTHIIIHIDFEFYKKILS